MKRFKWVVLLTIIILSTTPAFAGWAPTVVQDSLQRLYPKVDMGAVAWSQDQGYFLGNFTYDGYTVRAYFNSNGQCMMAQTDLGGMDNVPSAVYNAFTMSDFASYTVQDVTLVDFPKWQPIYVILIQQPNLEGEIQLFYNPYGQLLRQRSTVGLDDILGPSTFL